MHGLPKDFDGSVFVGKEVMQVCFTVNQVSIHFEDAMGITAEGPLCHSLTMDDEGTTYEPPIRNGELQGLVGHAVTEATVIGPGDLRLRFDDGQSLIFCDDTPAYESYHIRLGDKEIHV